MAHSHISASMAALADGEIVANRQVCPAIVGGGVKMCWPGSASQRVGKFSDTRIPPFPTVRFQGSRFILIPVVEAALEEPSGN
jgi:hypothetical protein